MIIPDVTFSVGFSLALFLFAGNVVAEPVVGIEKANVVADAPGGGLQIVGNRLYVAAWGHGFHVLDISNPVQPKWVGGWNNHTCPLGVYVVGHYAYLANRTSGFDVIDVQNPESPLQAGHLYTGGDAQSVYVSGHLAYVADLHRGLDVIDVSDPRKPELVGNGDTRGQAFSTQVANGFAYVSYGGEGLRVYDLADIAKPKQISQCPNARGGKIQLLGDTVYFSGFDGFQKIDVKIPSRPTVRGVWRGGSIYKGSYTAGQYAYVPLQDDGLHIIDVSNPDKMQSVGFYKTSYCNFDVRVVGKYAYLMDCGASIHVIDVSDPANPKEVGGFSACNYSSKVLSLTNVVVTKAGSQSKAITSIEAAALGAITNAPPQLADPLRTTDGAFIFTLQGVPDAIYFIQASADLVSWATISTNTLPATGTLRISDPEAGSFQNRFYRATKKQ